jgi:sacsin
MVIQHLSTSCWIWNGEGFSSPEEVVIHSAGLSLKPYLFNIPDEFKVFEKIFLSANANPTLTADILINVLHSIKDFHDNAGSLSALEITRDLETVISILQWFAKRTKDDRILVPIETPGKRLELKPLSDCMYSESVSFFDDFSDEMEGRIFIIHHNVSINLAKALAVPSMTNHVLNADPFGFEDFGQHESLTQRIMNILEEYDDKAGTFKEPLQNADDAGATEVVFVIDYRSNENSMTGLIDPGMKACHGSALWAYNNAKFTEADFVNIQKLGGQTKKDLVDKIGRFGIGFNAVYHVTDVPSFVSGNHVVFLDPCQTHLNDVMRNKSKPGIRIDFMKNKYLKHYKGQFEPFNDMFGCCIVSTEGKLAEPFKGTLFRLPFRTQLQVRISCRCFIK